MQEREVAEPDVGADDVLVQVEAAGLNHLDEKIRRGEFRQILPYRLPVILGNDVAGTVVAVGANVDRFTPGDEVYARPSQDRMGAFAERVSLSEADVAHKPVSLTMTEAGSLPLVALTAWQALVERGQVGPGHKVLIHAGAGGVGSIAIQLATHLGATVATTASAANADFVRHLGADTVIDYRSQDFEQLLSGFDLVLDSQGGEVLEKSLRILKPGGRVIGIAGPPDPGFARQAGASVLLRVAIAGLSARIRRRAKKLGVTFEFLFVRASGDQLRELTSLIDEGALRPIVGKVVPFEQLPQALESLGGGGIRGKAVMIREPLADQRVEAADHNESRRS